jgi:acyl carrier protein
MPAPLTDDQVQQIQHNFRRCREGTVDAIVQLKNTGDPEYIPPIVRGIVWRYVHENVRSRVDEATPETPLASLGIDSLTMMEVVLDVQDALDLVIEDEDLKNMKTIGDVVGFLRQRFTEVHPAG